MSRAGAPDHARGCRDLPAGEAYANASVCPFWSSPNAISARRRRSVAKARSRCIGSGLKARRRRRRPSRRRQGIIRAQRLVAGTQRRLLDAYARRSYAPAACCHLPRDDPFDRPRPSGCTARRGAPRRRASAASPAKPARFDAAHARRRKPKSATVPLACRASVDGIAREDRRRAARTTHAHATPTCPCPRCQRRAHLALGAVERDRGPALPIAVCLCGEDAVDPRSGTPVPTARRALLRTVGAVAARRRVPRRRPASLTSRSDAKAAGDESPPRTGAQRRGRDRELGQAHAPARRCRRRRPEPSIGGASCSPWLRPSPGPGPPGGSEPSASLGHQRLYLRRPEAAAGSERSGPSRRQRSLTA